MFSFLDTSLYGDRNMNSGFPNGRPQASAAAALQQASAATFAAAQRPSLDDEIGMQGAALPAMPVTTAAGDKEIPVVPQDQTQAQMMYEALEALQAKVMRAEKRSMLSEQRLLSALQETQSRLSRVDDGKQTAQGGCSWSMLLVLTCIGACIFFLARNYGSAPSGSLPVMMPSGLPTSPVVLPLSGSGLAPTSFLRSV
jgi:hypothetical protein